MDTRERLPLERALIRIFSGGRPCGAGFLVGPGHVLTAAHVVADALGLEDGADLPKQAWVDIDFPLAAPEVIRQARVEVWRRPGRTQGSDIAGLRLVGAPPAAARPVVVSRQPGRIDDPLVMVGFPRGLDAGQWVVARQGGRVANGCDEIVSDPGRRSALAPGFSGTAVWSSVLDAVVGMVVYKVSGAGDVIGYMVPVEILLDAWPSLVDVLEQRAPFPALRPFEEQDADYFFGREETANRITGWILGGDPPSAISVIGGSGAGKSSLWRAGIVPRLRAADRILIGTMRPSDAGTPLTALAFALDALIEPDRTADARMAAVAGLAERLRDGAMADVTAAMLRSGRADRLVVCVDQFEEVFAAGEDDRRAFIAAVSACLRQGSRFTLVVNVRDVFLQSVLSDRLIAELARRWLPVTLGELTDAELRRVMTGPPARIGTVAFADGLVEKILQDLRLTPSPLPLLQFTLAALWERRSAGSLTHQAYDDLGGVSRALAEYADRVVWGGLEPSAKEDAERLLVQLARPVPDRDLMIRRTVLREDCDEGQWAVAQRLAAGRLVVMHDVRATAEKATKAGVELAHDSLLTQWEQLARLTARMREFRLWQDALRQRMAVWQAHGEARSRLLSRSEQRDAKRWSASHDAHIGPGEKAFIKASTRHRKQLTTAVAAVLVLAAVITLAVYENRSREVGRSVAGTAARDLAAKAQQLRSTDTYGAILLAMRAYATDSSVGRKTGSGGGDLPVGVDAPGILDKILPDADYADDTSATGPGADAVASLSGVRPTVSDQSSESTALQQKVSADGRTLVTTDFGRHVVIWHIDGQTVQAESLAALFGPDDYATTPVISRSGRYVAWRQTVQFNKDDINMTNGTAVVAEHYHTCVPRDITSLTACLVVYDTAERRIVVAKEVPGLSVVANPVLSIDPTDHLLGLVTASDPLASRGPAPTLYQYDLTTGDLRRQDVLPWQTTILDLWLGAGGSTAVLFDGVIDTAARTGIGDVSFLEFGAGSVSRHQLVSDPKIQQVAVSLDGGTVAVLVGDPSGGTYQLGAWATATGATGRHLTGIPAGEVTGFAVDATGTGVWLTYAGAVGSALTATDITQISVPANRLTIWPLTDAGPSRQFPVAHLSQWPLGSGVDAPFIQIENSSLGLVLTRPGGPTPLKRSADATTGEHQSGATSARMCELLGEPNQDSELKDLIPAGAARGPLCR